MPVALLAKEFAALRYSANQGLSRKHHFENLAKTWLRLVTRNNFYTVTKTRTHKEMFPLLFHYLIILMLLMIYF